MLFSVTVLNSVASRFNEAKRRRRRGRRGGVLLPSRITRMQKDGVIPDIRASGFLNPGMAEGEVCGLITVTAG